jgi:hypothetical protein
MTGVDPLDLAATIAFGLVTVLALLRIGRSRRRDLRSFADDGFHAVMGVAMTAMSWPGGDRTTPVWVAGLGMIVVWPMLVLGLAARRRPADLGHRTDADHHHRTCAADHGGQAPTGPPSRRFSAAQTGYWLTSGLLMTVAVGAGHPTTAGHGSASTPLPPMPAMTGSAHQPVEAGLGSGALGAGVQAIAGWPIWPVVGIGLLLYAGWLLLGPRCTLLERVCAVVMATGMAGMALTL